MISEVKNIDCMVGMKEFPDKFFDLAIVDPPYFNGPQHRKFYGKAVSGHGVRRVNYDSLKTSWSGMMRGNSIKDGCSMNPNKNKQQKRIHPTEKPIELYSWCLQTYAKEGDRILDTHLGSGSHRIAANNLGFDFYGFEKDTNMFNKQEKRYHDLKLQNTIQF